MRVSELLWSWPNLSLAGTGCCAAWCGERWSGRQPGSDRRASGGHSGERKRD